MLRMKIIANALMVNLALATTVEAGSVLFVDDDAPAGGDGSSWETAHRFLQDALEVAADGPDFITMIQIAQGLYQPDLSTNNPDWLGDRNKSFKLLADTAMVGGFAGINAKNPDARDIELYETILSGDLLNNDGEDFTNTEDNSFHVMSSIESFGEILIDGLTIMAGNANGAQFPDDCGAGYINTLLEPVIVNCTFKRNQSLQGGAIYAECGVNFDCLTMIDCIFEDNFAALAGGAVFLQDASSDITECVFMGNTSNGLGGAFFVDSTSTAIDNCILSENNAAVGGAIYAVNNPSNRSFSIVGSQVLGNWATEGGGIFTWGWSDIYITSSQIEDNSAFADGGGANIRQCDFLTVFKSTFENNFSARGAGLMIDQCESLLSASQFINNSAVFDGGGMYVVLSEVFMIQCNMNLNSAFNLGGGGLFATNSELDLLLCNISGNSSGSFGAGVTIENSQATIDLCDISGNSFLQSEAAIGDQTGGIFVRDSTFEMTDSNVNLNIGGGAEIVGSSALVKGCTFSENAGEGVRSVAIDEVKIHYLDCVFRSNEFRGADIVGEHLFVNCIFASNTALNGAGLQGGAPTLVNCLFVANHALSFGGAIIATGGEMDLINCTLAYNTAGNQTGGLYFQNDAFPIVQNCIFWGNEDQDGMTEDAQFHGNSPQNIEIQYSNIQALEWPFVNVLGNISIDPLFIDPDGIDDELGTPDDNLRIGISSPSIDAADNSALVAGTFTDLDGNPRLLDDPCFDDTGQGDSPIVDMGSYEFQGSSAGPGDINGDCVVATSDLVLLLNSWGPCNNCQVCIADINGDCTVGVADLIILFGGWS